MVFPFWDVLLVGVQSPSMGCYLTVFKLSHYPWIATIASAVLMAARFATVRPQFIQRSTPQQNTKMKSKLGAFSGTRLEFNVTPGRKFP